MKIGVTGATGQLGRLVVQELLPSVPAQDIVAIVRNAAKAAYLRSINQGSTIAALNLGLMLAGQGDHDEALPYLHQAAGAGDSGGFWGIGKINEQRRQWPEAAAAYRKGAELGDAACAYGLGVALYELGDRDNSRAAFEQARDLGHEGAKDLLETFDREDGAPGGVGASTVGQLWSDVTGVYGALASHRHRLGRQWIEATLVVQQRQAQMAALKRGGTGDVGHRHGV